MIQDPEGLTVRSARDGGFIVEDEDYDEVFCIDPNVELADLIRQIVEIYNKGYRLGLGRGRCDLKDDFRRLMGVPRT